jgi:hypothetical protein
MLSGLLNTDIAIKTSINIMKAFVLMRHFLKENSNFFHKFQQIDQKLIEHDNNFDKIFDLMQNNIPKQGIFFDGEIIATGTGTYPQIIDKEIRWVAVRGMLGYIR